MASLATTFSLFAPFEAMAKTAPELRLTTLGPDEMVTKPAPPPTNREPPSNTLRPNSETRPLNNVGCEANVTTNNSNALKQWSKIGWDDVSDDIGWAPLIHGTIIGVASTYNPYTEGSREKGTASGEPYNADAWTAAIRIDLRDQFGGVRYGKNYQATYALVERGDKHLIVKINDVGPLAPGRIIDLNENSMRYFEPSLQAGLIHDVRISRLSGEDWTPGPIGAGQTAAHFCPIFTDD